MIRILAMMIVLLAMTPVMAQDGAVLASGALVERYAPAAEISGTPLVGLVAAGQVDPALRRIMARIPADWVGETVCARMVSSDGRYEAEREYSVPAGWQSGLANLDFPTRYGEQLAEFGAQELGVLVTRGSCGNQADERQIVPAGWNLTNQSDSAALMVNSFRADETYLIVAALGLDISCQPVASSRRTAFDTICPLPASLLDASGLVSVELNRIRRGVMMPGDLFSIDLR